MLKIGVVKAYPVGEDQKQMLSDHISGRKVVHIALGQKYGVRVYAQFNDKAFVEGTERRKMILEKGKIYPMNGPSQDTPILLKDIVSEIAPEATVKEVEDKLYSIVAALMNPLEDARLRAEGKVVTAWKKAPSRFQQKLPLENSPEAVAAAAETHS